MWGFAVNMETTERTKLVVVHAVKFVFVSQLMLVNVFAVPQLSKIESNKGYFTLACKKSCCD